MTPTRPAVRCRAACAHVRDRLASRREEPERGDMLVEALIFMVVISITVLSYVVGNQQAQHVQRSSIAKDIVMQQAQGVLEQAQSTPWARLGFASSQTGFRVKDAKNRLTATLPATLAPPVSSDPTQAIQPTTTLTTRAIEMTQTVDIAWDTTSGPVPASDAYGTKVVTVTITYPGGTRVYSLKRTAGASEAVPTALASLEAADTSPISEPPSATTCPNTTRSGNTLTWAAVPEATHYFVSARNSSGEYLDDLVVTGTSYTLASGTTEYQVDSGNSGNRATCPWRT